MIVGTGWALLIQVAMVYSGLLDERPEQLIQ